VCGGGGGGGGSESGGGVEEIQTSDEYVFLKMKSVDGILWQMIPKCAID